MTEGRGVQTPPAVHAVEPETSPRAPARVRARQEVAAGLRDNLLLVWVLVPLIAAAFVIEALTGVPVARRLRDSSVVDLGSWALRFGLVMVVLSAGVFAATRLAALLGARRAGRPADVPSLRAAWEAYGFRPSGRRFLRTVVCLLAVALFFHVFVGFKGAIPLFKPFAWDEAFMRLDRALHFGQDPWRLLHPVLGYPLVTRVLDFFYYLWFPVKLVGILWFAWMADGPERRQFFLAFFGTWILLGNAAALVFSSAGPCYFDLATGSLGPFAELMAYLRDVDAVHGLLALEVQAMLLEGYSSTEPHTVEGIAAMPSLHVAIPFLYALAVHRTSRRAAWGFAAFGVITLLGSVHLGWHYAVDGYASMLAVPLIWVGAGWMVGKLDRTGTRR